MTVTEKAGGTPGTPKSLHKRAKASPELLFINTCTSTRRHKPPSTVLLKKIGVKELGAIILSGKLRKHVFEKYLVAGRDARDARGHTKYDSQFIKLTCVPGEPEPLGVDMSLC